MSKLDSLPARMLLRNGALLIIPPMVITFGLWGVLPAAYGPDLFWKGIPEWLSLLENSYQGLAADGRRPRRLKGRRRSGARLRCAS